MAARAVTADELQAGAARLRQTDGPRISHGPVVQGGPAGGVVRAAHLREAAHWLQHRSVPASAPPRMVKVKLTFMDGSDMEFDVDATRPVRAFRSQVAEKLGITQARVKLVFGQKVLQVDDFLDDVGISDGALVNALVVPPLYEGSQAYTAVAENLNHVFQGSANQDEQVRETMMDMMAKKSSLNDAFAKLKIAQ